MKSQEEFRGFFVYKNNEKDLNFTWTTDVYYEKFEITGHVSFPEVIFRNTFRL